MDRHRPSLSYQHLLVYSPETDQLAGLDVGDDAVLAPPLTQREVIAKRAWPALCDVLQKKHHTCDAPHPYFPYIERKASA